MVAHIVFDDHWQNQIKCPLVNGNSGNAAYKKITLIRDRIFGTSIDYDAPKRGTFLSNLRLSKDSLEAPHCVLKTLQVNLFKKFNKDQRKSDMATSFLDLLGYYRGCSRDST